MSDPLCGAFEDFTASVRPAETVMRGELRDQSELRGLLDRIQSLGLELVSIRQLEPGSHEVRRLDPERPAR